MKPQLLGRSRIGEKCGRYGRLDRVARKVSQGMLDTHVSGMRMVRHTGSD